MGKRPDPPKEEKAPAYMTMYSALWCIMLAFFVVLMTLGRQKSDKYKKGIGAVKNAFGVRGGMGMMEYWRKASDGQGDNNPNPPDEQEEGDVVGHFKGMLWKEGLSNVSILKTEFDDRGISITIDTPIEFVTNSAVLGREACAFLSRMGGVFYNMPGFEITVQDLTMREKDTDDRNLLLAIERASAVTRYLQDEARIPADRIIAVGFSNRKYLTALKSDPRDQALIFSLRKLN